MEMPKDLPVPRITSGTIATEWAVAVQTLAERVQALEKANAAQEDELKRLRKNIVDMAAALNKHADDITTLKEGQFKAYRGVRDQFAHITNLIDKLKLEVNGDAPKTFSALCEFFTAKINTMMQLVKKVEVVSWLQDYGHVMERLECLEKGVPFVKPSDEEQARWEEEHKACFKEFTPEDVLKELAADWVKP